MLLELKQNLKLSQQLVITQQIQQAIKLLQLAHLELVTQVQQELVENPALEEIPGTSPDGDQDQPAGGERPGEPEDPPGADGGERIDWDRFLEGYSSSKPAGAPSNIGLDELPPIEANLVRAASLSEHLLWQLQLQSATEPEVRAARVIIHNLDGRGYLAATLELVAEQAEVELDYAEGALDIVQQLDPLGCGSRDLRECLRIQARVMAPDDPFLPVIIDEHLAHLEVRNYQAIARALDMAVEDAVEYHRMIRKMEPVPGRDFSDVSAHYITPDIYVFKVGGEWQIVQNEDGLPKLRVSSYFGDLLRRPGTRKEDRDYIKDRLQSATFLIQSIHKRQRTIYRVVEAILSRQREFFDRGVDHLRPMVLRDVAEDIGVHESTVSRATTQKYVQCPQGLYELKYFFNAAIQRVGGGDVASETVKNRIRQIVAKEDTDRPFSDQSIVAMLEQEGFKVARRTVAKYRDEQGILPSSKRRKMF